jgi:serine/threonine protein phosphatase Stp1
MNKTMRAYGYGATHVGLVRSVNEDSMTLNDGVGVWLVADGMGGHADGKWASETIVNSMQTLQGCSDFGELVDGAAAAIHTANATIYESSTQRGIKAGSTVVALCIREEKFACIWAGDSRIYLLRDGSLIQMTHDHTQVRAMVAAGLITEEDAENHPLSHVLARAVGAQAELELDAIEDTLQNGDIFLLCSDGLSGLVSDPEIESTLNSEKFEVAGAKLLETTLARGAPDNVTFVGVRIEEATAIITSVGRAMSHETD